MQIKNIKVSNFKSFEEEEIELGRFNVLIGANASGKSNFINILQFLKDIVENGLDNAISMQGGVDYIRNINIGASKNLSIELQIESKEKPIKLSRSFEAEERVINILPTDFMYGFIIEFPGGKRYRVVDERLVVTFDFSEEVKRKKGDKKKQQKTKEGKLIFTRDKEGIDYSLEPRDLPMKIEDIVPPIHTKKKFFSKELSLGRLVSPFHFITGDFFSTISIYDFDPKLSKSATPITGKRELEPDGSNLAVVLKDIMGEKKKRERISNLIKDLLPFIDELTVEKLPDKSLLTRLKEVYSEKKSLPAFLMSDGTINITALIIALYFERKPLIVIEEPERNIHPYLISKVIGMMNDVSERQKKQIIVTTHNPEVVRYTDIENILLVHRDDEGFTQISRPAEKEEVKIFLENKMGIEELYVQNLLEW